jgi:hypothetical protein
MADDVWFNWVLVDGPFAHKAYERRVGAPPYGLVIDQKDSDNIISTLAAPIDDPVGGETWTYRKGDLRESGIDYEYHFLAPPEPSV